MDDTPFVIELFSFGFKHGMAEADLVWDVRFLPNPYWVEALREHSGLEPEVAAHVLDNAVAGEFLELLEPLLLFSCDRHAGGKRARLRIAIGCTGGRHRSVAVVDYLARALDRTPYRLHVFHRDLDKR